MDWITEDYMKLERDTSAFMAAGRARAYEHRQEPEIEIGTCDSEYKPLTSGVDMTQDDKEEAAFDYAMERG